MFFCAHNMTLLFVKPLQVLIIIFLWWLRRRIIVRGYSGWCRRYFGLLFRLMQKTCTWLNLTGLSLLSVRFLFRLVILIRVGIGIMIALFLTFTTMETCLRSYNLFLRNDWTCDSHWFWFGSWSFRTLFLVLLLEDLRVKVLISWVNEILYLLRHIK